MFSFADRSDEAVLFLDKAWNRAGCWAYRRCSACRPRTVEGRLAHRDGDLAAAHTLLQRAVGLAGTFGEPLGLVATLTSLAETELDKPHRGLI